MMKNLRGKKLWALVTALVVAVAAAVSMIWLLPLATQNPDARISSKIPEVVPASADMVVIGPANTSDSQRWWDTVSGYMTKDAHIENVKPYAEKSFDLLNYGYSRSANPNPPVVPDATAKVMMDVSAGPDQAVYLESKTEDGAINVEKWLKDNKIIDRKFDTVSTRVGTVNIISRKMMMDHLTVDNKDKKVGQLSSRNDFTVKSPTMWMNFDRQQEILSTGATGDKAAAVKEMFNKGLGISPGTVWQSTTEDLGVSWSGGYVSGGVKKSNLDSQSVVKAFESDAKPVSTNTNKTSTTPLQATTHEFDIINPGLSKALDYLTIQYSDAGQPVIGSPTSTPPAGNALVSADLKLSAWNNLTDRTNIGRNAYASQSIRANEGDLSMHFEQGSSVPSDLGTPVAPPK